MTDVDWPREGVHTDIAAEDYHAAGITKQPALSASIAKILLGRSPLHAWHAHPQLNPNWQPDDRDIFDLGTAAHVLFLEGEEYASRVAPLDFRDWKTKAAQTARDEARAEGLTPILAKHWDRTLAMVTAVREQLPTLDVAPPMFAGGKSECTLIWQEENGVTCKSRLDYLHDTFRAADDFKSVTTERGSAKPETWERTFWSTGCDIEAVFHSRGVHALTGKWPEFRFLVAECAPPYGVSVLTLHEEVLELGKQKVDLAIAKWAQCLETGSWPSYSRQAAVVKAGWRQHEELLALEQAAA